VHIVENYSKEYNVSAAGLKRFCDNNFHAIHIEIDTLFAKREHIAFLAAKELTHN